eukprot:gene1608-3103_t
MVDFLSLAANSRFYVKFLRMYAPLLSTLLQPPARVEDYLSTDRTILLAPLQELSQLIVSAGVLVVWLLGGYA